MRDAKEALEIFDQLTDDQQRDALAKLRKLVQDKGEDGLKN